MKCNSMKIPLVYYCNNQEMKRCEQNQAKSHTIKTFFIIFFSQNNKILTSYDFYVKNFAIYDSNTFNYEKVDVHIEI